MSKNRVIRRKIGRMLGINFLKNWIRLQSVKTKKIP